MMDSAESLRFMVIIADELGSILKEGAYRCLLLG
jgi:hypothetical protein